MSTMSTVLHRAGALAAASAVAGTVLATPTAAYAARGADFDPSHYVLATETPALKAPAAKATAPAKKSTTAGVCAKGRTHAVVKGKRVCVVVKVAAKTPAKASAKKAPAKAAHRA